MPKQVKVIDDFSGGLNAFSGSRKIEDNELVKLEGLSTGANGTLKSGTIAKLATSAADGNGLDPYPTALAVNEQAGHNVYTFNSDRHYNGRQNDGTDVTGEHWVASADHTAANKVQIFGRNNGQSLTISSITAASDAAISTSAAHNLTTSSYVRFAGIAGTMGTLLNNTIHKVKGVTDADTFTIEEDSSSASTTIGSDGRVKGGAPGWIDAGDKPAPHSSDDAMIDFAFVDGALRTSNSNFASSSQINNWWGWIDRILFTETAQTDTIPAEYYSINAECAKPNPSTFLLAETLPTTPATYAWNPDLSADGASDTTDTAYVHENTLDGTLGNAPTITQIDVEVDIVDEMSGSGIYNNVQITVGRSVDSGSSFDSTNYNLWTISGRGSSTRTFTWTGSWAIADGDDKGIRATLVTTDADVDDAIVFSITDIKISTGSGTWTNHTGLQGNNVHVGFNEDTLAGSTGWGGNWEVGVSLLYDYPRRQESTITTCTNETGGGVGYVALTEGKAPTVMAFIKYDNDSGTAANNWNKRVTGCKIYMRELQSPKSSDRSEWFPQAKCDFMTGEITAYESGTVATALYPGNSQHIFKLPKEDFIRPHKRSTYEIESGVPEDETVTNPRYKTSVVANRRLYVGNVMATYPDGVEEVLGDTMIKSVVDNYDVLPLQNAIDVAIKDGDEIVRLMEYGDRILQFKKNTLYVINISQDREYLEATYRGKGIPVKSAAVETDYGIVWANQHSCYLYNGRTIVDLLVDRQGKRKIDPAVWTGVIKTTIDSPVNLGYSATGKVLVVDPDASDVTVKNAYVYDFKTGSWSIQPDSLTVNSSDTRSNFVKRWDGELMYGSAGRFHLWKDDLHKGDEAEFITKDYILGAPNKTVKLYNVYITYKSTEAISSCLSRLRYAIDGTGNFSAFNNCTVGGSTVTSLPITWTNLKAGGTDVLTNGTTTGAAANEVIVLDYTTELVANDFISIAGDNNEYMKVLETEDTDSIKVQRGHPIGGVLDATSNDSQVTVLKWKQAKFGITSTVDSETRNGVTCNSVQLRFNPNVSAGLMVQSIIFEYRPLYKESA